MNDSFRLHIGKERSRLVLLGGGEEIATREWEESRDMGNKLFEAIDSLLKESGMARTDIAHFSIETDIPESFTSVRIAQSVAKVWEYGAKENSSSVNGLTRSRVQEKSESKKINQDPPCEWSGPV